MARYASSSARLAAASVLSAAAKRSVRPRPGLT